LIDGKDDDVDVLFSVADFAYIDKLGAVNNMEIAEITVKIKVAAGFKSDIIFTLFGV
jgi:hypothetical protein